MPATCDVLFEGRGCSNGRGGVGVNRSEEEPNTFCACVREREDTMEPVRLCGALLLALLLETLPLCDLLWL